MPKTTTDEQTATNGEAAKEETSYVNAKLTAKQLFALEQVCKLTGEKQIDYTSRVLVEAIKRDADPQRIREQMEAQLSQLSEL